MAEVESGVPQESVVGSLLFIIFIDAIGENVMGYVNIFADDLKIMGRVNSKEQVDYLQAHLSGVSD